jgi:hypothetical protein
MNEQAIEALMAEVPAFARKIAPVYKLLGWTWYDDSVIGKYVPSNEQIEAKLRYLINRLSDAESVSSGGLYVWIDDGDAGMEMMISKTCFGVQEEGASHA